MRPCELTAVDIAYFSKLITEAEEFNQLSYKEQTECEDALRAAMAFAANYTGVDMKTTQLEDLTYAIKTIAAEMIDNHQITAQYTGKNPTAVQILDMHSTNLLPSVGVI